MRVRYDPVPLRLLDSAQYGGRILLEYLQSALVRRSGELDYALGTRPDIGTPLHAFAGALRIHIKHYYVAVHLEDIGKIGRCDIHQRVQRLALCQIRAVRSQQFPHRYAESPLP